MKTETVIWIVFCSWCFTDVSGTDMKQLYLISYMLWTSVTCKLGVELYCQNGSIFKIQNLVT